MANGGGRGCQAIHGTPSSLLCQTGTLQALGKCNNYCVCVCVHSLPVSCSLDAYSLRKYDPKTGQAKSYDFVVETLKAGMPACLSEVDLVLSNRCKRGGTTPLLHHTPVAPHHSHPYCTTPQSPLLHHTTCTPIDSTWLAGKANGKRAPAAAAAYSIITSFGTGTYCSCLHYDPAGARQHLHCRHRGGGARPQRLRCGPGRHTTSCTIKKRE